MKDILHNPKKLHRLTELAVWIQAVLGGILLAQTWESVTKYVAIGLLMLTLLCVHIGKKHHAARVTARVITGLFWFVAVLFIGQIVLAALYYWPYYGPELMASTCYFCGLFLCHFAPATVSIMVCDGEHFTAYDRVTGVACQTALVPVTALCLFADTDVPWTFGKTIMPYIWGAVVILVTLLVWFSAKRLTEEQKTALQLRREKRTAKRAKR